jgi:hypothetical protein
VDISQLVSIVLLDGHFPPTWLVNALFDHGVGTHADLLPEVVAGQLRAVWRAEFFHDAGLRLFMVRAEHVVRAAGVYEGGHVVAAMELPLLLQLEVSLLVLLQLASERVLQLRRLVEIVILRVVHSLVVASQAGSACRFHSLSWGRTCLLFYIELSEELLHSSVRFATGCRVSSTHVVPSLLISRREEVLLRC